MLKQIKDDLKKLGFSRNEINIYVALTALGESPATVVAKKADLPRTTTISILNKLAEENYLSTHRYHGTNYYWVETPKTIQGILAGKLAIAENLGNLLANLYRSESKFPFGQVYDTKKGVSNFIEKLLLNLKPKIIIKTIDTPHVGNYDKIFGANFWKLFIDLKQKKGIATHTLIPAGAFNDINPEKLKNQNILIREMPKEIKNFSASIWLLNDHLILFSGKPPFLIDVYHPAICPSIEGIYDYLWNISLSKK